MAIQLPEKFEIPTIQTYTGVEDPTEHLDNYKTHMDLQGDSAGAGVSSLSTYLVWFCPALVPKTPSEFHHKF
jgi:hypothetical protein